MVRRLLLPLRGEEGEAEVEPPRDVGGILTDDLLVLDDGLVAATGVAERGGEAGPDVDEVRAERERAAKLGDGLGVEAGREVDLADVRVHVRELAADEVVELAVGGA